MPLTQAEIEKFKQILLSLRDRLSQQVKGASISFAEESFKPSEDGSDDFAQKLSMDVSGRELATLRQIGRALEKIEENSYGVCDLTGEEIAKARLHAVPYAVMTVKAQEKWEKGLL